VNHVRDLRGGSPDPYVFSVERRVARRGECLERRLARYCDMVTQQRDHATHRK